MTDEHLDPSTVSVSQAGDRSHVMSRGGQTASIMEEQEDSDEEPETSDEEKQSLLPDIAKSPLDSYGGAFPNQNPNARGRRNTEQIGRSPGQQKGMKGIRS